MMRRALLGLALLAGSPTAAGAATPPTPEAILALPLVGGGESPMLLFAQRAITRRWGPSDDSTYVEIQVPDWRSEGGAMAMSALVPGVGQAYVGEQSAFVYALAEVTGWAARWFYARRADSRRADAESYAGSPADPSSAWSFERWQSATGGDPSELERIYAADRQAFLREIATDPRYLAGWSGNPTATRAGLDDLLAGADRNQQRANVAGAAVWINHLVSAADALRAARIHNLPLRRNLELRLQTGWSGGHPGVTATLERRF